MKIANKVKAMVIPMVLIPILTIASGVILFGKLYIKNVFGSIDNTGIENYASPVFMLSENAERAIDQIGEDIFREPDRFLEEGYIEKLDKQLETTNVFLILRVGEEIVFSGREDVEEVFRVLPDYGDNSEAQAGVFYNEKNPFFLKQMDFTLKNGEKGSIFVVTYAESIVKNMRRVCIEMTLTVVGVIMLISGCISVYIYWIFVRPLKLLQKGTVRIKEGNLEEDVEVLADDEIGEVCQSFNEMRVKLKESVDDRLRYEQENRELIANISHDLKTPITAIKGYVEGIIDGVADTPEKMDRYIRTIYNKANEMDTLINELSLYTKVENNAIPYNFIKLNMEAYFQDCIEEIHMDLESNDVEFAYHNTCPKDMLVVADPEQLHRVIGNIITNAVKYNNKEHRRLWIDVEPYQEEVKIMISDNGNGIAEKDLPLIFKRMYRGDSSRNSATGGSGLGLAISKRIIEEHGGVIWAESEPGQGTRISFTLKVWSEKQEEDHE